jgi:Raf kinase inhibitor-like YbhB/YbcL family protein
MSRRAGATGGAGALAVVSAAGLLALAVLLAACGADDRAMAPPSPDQTTTTRASAPGAATPSDQDEVALLRLSSPTFATDTPMPGRYTCQGEGVSPQLQWSNVPAGTTTLALVVRDLDADGFVHWVVAGIDPNLGELIEGQLPAGTTTARNSFGNPGWGPPCPPSGTHRYELLLYALSQPLALSPDAAAADAVQQVQSTPALGTAALVGTVAAA